MARPRINPEDKMVKQSYSIKPKLLDALMRYCQKEERSMSWVIEKALTEYLTKKGEI